MTKVTIGAVYHNTENKEGQPLINVKGQPYTRVTILTKDKEGKDRKISGFGNDTTKTWNAGDVVELDLYENDYGWNFKEPRVVDRLGLILEELAIIKQMFAGSHTKTEKLDALKEVADRVAPEPPKTDLSPPIEDWEGYQN